MSQAAYHGPRHGGCGRAAQALFAPLIEFIGRQVGRIVLYEEWEVLYRQRLQVERGLLRIGSIEPPHERSAVSRIVEKVADLNS